MSHLIEKQGTLWTDSKTLLIYLDVETGGFSVDQNALLSVSICLPLINRKFKPLDWYMFPSSNRWVHREARAVNGFSYERWRNRGAISLEAALDRFVYAIEEIQASFNAHNVAFCAHNALFDRRFLLYNLQETGWDADESTWRWYCTKRTCRYYANQINGIRSFSLTTCCDAFRIRSRQAEYHESNEDVILGSKLILSLSRKGIGLLEA